MTQSNLRYHRADLQIQSPLLNCINTIKVSKDFHLLNRLLVYFMSNPPHEVVKLKPTEGINVLINVTAFSPIA